MKKIILIKFIIVFLLLSCHQRNKQGVDSKIEEINLKDENSQYAKLGIGNILIDSIDTYKYKKLYESKIRRPLVVINDKISQSVWFDKDAILLLGRYLKESSNNLDGIRIHFISYDTLLTAPGQYKPHQISIVMVPTSPSATDIRKHIDNWSILTKERIKADSFLKDNNFLYGLNHGELCPQKCER